jgi:phosphomannomutase
MVSPTFQHILELAQSWADADPEPAMAAQLREWIARRDELHLRECFEMPLSFGTAGLRGVVGPGPGHMNIAVVRRVTRSLADYLRANQLGNRPIVIGYDARIDSERFALEAIAVARAAGATVLEFGHQAPTPIVAYASLRKGAAAGIVVTASHNPPEYNGYKVYGPTALQIISPMDTLIAERMHQMPGARAIPTQVQPSTKTRYLLGEDIVENYIEDVLVQRPVPVLHPIRIAYTPLHGVGWNTLQRLFAAGGYADVCPVAEQVEPDGHFPTVSFPNPEEPGTLDLGMQFAQAISAHVLIANDPDADRLALALPDANGQWHAVTGNQLGVILMEYLLERAVTAGTHGRQPCVVTTLVSTPMADSLARAHGAHLERTLTGFKWLWTAVLELLKDGSRAFAMAWEEALGYSTHTSVRDKDGIAAGLIAADWVAQCHAAGVLPWERLGQLFREHGAWASRQLGVHCSGADGTAAMRGALEQLGSNPPHTLNGVRVSRFENYRLGAEERPYWRGQAELFALTFDDESRLLVRPSGTEPKLKIYIDVPAAVSVGTDPFTALQVAGKRAEALGKSLISAIGLNP